MGAPPRRRAGSGTMVYMLVLIVWVRAFREKSGSPDITVGQGRCGMRGF
jgi:hypothetical protein